MYTTKKGPNDARREHSAIWFELHLLPVPILFFPRRCEPCRTWAVRTKGLFRRHSSIWPMQQNGEKGNVVLCLINSWGGPLPRSQLPRGPLFLAHQKSFLSPPLFSTSISTELALFNLEEIYCGSGGGRRPQVAGGWVKWPNNKHFLGGRKVLCFRRWN